MTYAISVGCSLYICYFIHFISRATELTKVSHLIYPIPWMVTYTLKTLNMYHQHGLSTGFLQWSHDILTNVHVMPEVELIVKDALTKGLRLARILC